MGFKIWKVRRNMVESGGMETCSMLFIQFSFPWCWKSNSDLYVPVYYAFIYFSHFGPKRLFQIVDSDPRDCLCTPENPGRLEVTNISSLHPNSAQILNIVEQTRSWRGKKEPLCTPQAFNPFLPLSILDEIWRYLHLWNLAAGIEPSAPGPALIY